MQVYGPDACERVMSRVGSGGELAGEPAKWQLAPVGDRGWFSAALSAVVVATCAIMHAQHRMYDAGSQVAQWAPNGELSRVSEFELAAHVAAYSCHTRKKVYVTASSCDRAWLEPLAR